MSPNEFQYSLCVMSLDSVSSLKESYEFAGVGMNLARFCLNSGRI